MKKDLYKVLLTIVIFAILTFCLAHFVFGQSVSYIGVYYDEENCESTWTYRVHNDGPKDISHFVMQLCGHLCILDVNGDNLGFLEAMSSTAAWDIDYGYDPPTGICGVKYETTDTFTYDDIRFRIKGWPEVGLIDFTFKTGQDVLTVQVPGPDPSYDDCECSVLPIVLVDFSVDGIRGIHQLTWTTGEEANFSHFEIEHSLDAVDFYPVTVYNSRGKPFTYTYSMIPPKGNNYYRLRMVDLSGNYSFSQIVGMRNTIDLFENPLLVSKIQIFDVLGREITNDLPPVSIQVVRYEGRTYVVRRINNE